MTNCPPLHTVPLFEESTGSECTVTADTAVLEEMHPRELVPVIEYDVLAEGETV
jgi:hypothetical protein